MYSEVLVGIKEPDAIRDAIALARTLSPHARRLTLANVYDKFYVGQRGSAVGESVAQHHVSLELLGRCRDELAPDAELASHAATSVGDGLRDVAGRLRADLIVVGSCHRSRIGRVANGNDTVSIAHHAPCAVAVAPRGYADSAAGVRTIGVAYDGSTQSKIALRQARRLAGALGAQLKALDVKRITASEYGWVAPYFENEAIEIANERERLGDLEGVELSVVVGDTAAELERFSEQVDVLVCGSRELGPVGRVMLGSTSDSLVRRARSALVVIPAVAERASDAGHSARLSPTAA
jgi:nucleotide-binding universal stress UspA family protein